MPENSMPPLRLLTALLLMAWPVSGAAAGPAGHDALGPSPLAPHGGIQDAGVATAAPGSVPQDSLVVQAVVDSIVAAALAEGQAAGMSVAVARRGEVLLNRGYGMAELELEVPTPPDAIYEIGSVTKQFTAAAIFQLVEQGKLDLDADLTTYLPDYPTGGRSIPVRRLLDHTSGIRGYTEIPEFQELAIRDVPRDTLIAAFSSKPFDFEPGEAAIYNNSAYYLLGLIIEERSGLDYEEYVEAHLFEPLGMTRSSYCSERRITPGKTKGYSYTPDGLRHKEFLVHSHPYAAGSLCSTTGDLVTWTRALHSGRVLGPEAYEEMVTGGVLNDGTRLRYGAALSLTQIQGNPAIHHGGGIFGFLSNLAYLPEHDLTIAVLINTTGPVGPAGITAEIVEALVGARPLEGVPFTGEASRFAGEYEAVGRGGSLEVQVSAREDGLMLSMGQSQADPQPLVYLGDDTFALGTNRFTFEWTGAEVARIRADMGAMYTFLEPR
jgi:CubicO group peptidase (beta-lactamase class C family)